MKNVVRCLTSALVISMFVVSASAQKNEADTEVAALRKADAHWAKVAGAKDVDAFMMMVAENGSLLSPNAPILKGKKAIRQWASEMMANPGFALSWATTSADVSKAADLGYTMGTYTLTLHDPQGAAMTDRGKYMTVWKKNADGKWNVVADMFNSDLPMPGHASHE